MVNKWDYYKVARLVAALFKMNTTFLQSQKPAVSCPKECLALLFFHERLFISLLIEETVPSSFHVS